MPGSEVHNKTIKVNGFTVLQDLLASVGVCQALHCRRIMGGPTIGRPRAEPYVSMQNLFHCSAGSRTCKTAARNQLNCRGSRPLSRVIRHAERLLYQTSTRSMAITPRRSSDPDP